MKKKKHHVDRERFEWIYFCEYSTYEESINDMVKSFRLLYQKLLFQAAFIVQFDVFE